MGVPLRANVYFAGRTIWADGVPAYLDRLGTNRANGARFRPYGDEITATSNDREKFATYTRDSYTGLDYADQRWFTSSYGLFNTADPYQASGGPSDPGSWNRYSYVEGDPANGNDPAGLIVQAPGDCDNSNLWDGCSNRSNSLAYYYCGTASDAVLALSPELSPICSQILQAGLPVAGPSAPEQTDAPVWHLDMGYTPTLNFGSVGGVSYDHLFIWLHPDANPVYGWVFDGGPAGNCKTQCGNDTAWSSTLGHYSELTNASAVDFFTASLADGGAVLQQLRADTASISASSHPYNPVFGPNSNSVVYSELQSLGVSAPISTAYGSPFSPLGVLNWTVNGRTQLFTGWGQNVLP